MRRSRAAGEAEHWLPGDAAKMLMLMTVQAQIEQLQKDLSESGLQERLDRLREEHGRLLQAELTNHAAALEAAKVSSNTMQCRSAGRYFGQFK